MAAQHKPEIASYVDFLKTKPVASAKEYIVSKFKDHDLVVLCERDHREFTQYEMILDVLKDPDFVKNGVLFTEVGARSLSEDLNAFLRSEHLAPDELARRVMQFQRDCAHPLWEKPNFSYLIEGIYRANQNLSARNKIKMFPTDIFYVDGEPTKEKYFEMIQNMIVRDSLMADYIVQSFDKIKKANPKAKALVVMNYRHAYKLPLPSQGKMTTDNVAFVLHNKYKNKIGFVLIHSGDPQKAGVYNDGMWDAAFKAQQIEDAGFDLKNTPFGKDNFGQWVEKTDYTYQDLFDGYVFYQPIEKFKIGMGVTGIMDGGFEAEYLKRFGLYIEVLFGDFMKRPVPSAEEIKKEAFKRNLNETQFTQTENMDQIQKTIDSWL